MNQASTILIEKEIRKIIFTNQLDEFCGYLNSFPDYLKVIREHTELFENEIKSFSIKAAKENIHINKNTVGYDFLLNSLGKYSSKHHNHLVACNKTENTKILVIEEDIEEVNFFDVDDIKIKHSKPGRPKSSKNKKNDFTDLPKYTVTKDNFLDAVRDIVWYKEGLKANEILEFLIFDESFKKFIYHQLYNNRHLFKIVQSFHKNIEVKRIYSANKRTGYFYDGRLVSLCELAKITGKSKQILSYRMKKGMNHFQAINEEINANMARKNPGE
jgi:hypothetical protein